MEMLTDRLRERLEGHSIHTVQDLLAKDADDLSTIPGIGPVTARKLLDMASQALEESIAEDAEKSVVGEE
jgi:DNA-directed RNA polymerase alpha subunit